MLCKKNNKKLGSRLIKDGLPDSLLHKVSFTLLDIACLIHVPSLQCQELLRLTHVLCPYPPRSLRAALCGACTWTSKTSVCSLGRP